MYTCTRRVARMQQRHLTCCVPYVSRITHHNGVYTHAQYNSSHDDMIQGKLLHTTDYKSDISLENDTEHPFDNSSEHPLEKLQSFGQYH